MRVLHLLVLLVLVLPVGMVSLPAAAQPATSQPDGLEKVEGLVLEELAAKGQTDFFVWIAETADLSPADQLCTKAEKGQFVFNTLRATAQRTQGDVLSVLDREGVDYRAFYIVNAILVRGGDEALLTELAPQIGVDRITTNRPYQLPEPIKDPEPPARVEAVEPNLSFVNADEVWALGVTGLGTVMAGNDTGLDEAHPAVARHYRGCLNPPACTSWDHNYNWWDATGTYPTGPSDGHGHGTHTTGIMVGDDGGGNQIGMAPGAQTIHCKNMNNSGSGSDASFLECFEWDLAPWDLNGQNPNPALAPDAVNNSWGYAGGGQNQLRPAIDALQAAGIVVEVSAGNEGPSCRTLRSPADYAEVLTTGSVNHLDAHPGTLSDFSSRGPSNLDPGYFPDIMAPGESIRSSWAGGGYESYSGTSLAGPHATALIGLLWSANPDLRGQIDATQQIIGDTAVPLTGQTGSNCGGDYVNGPNNDWGYGTIDAYQAVLQAIALGGAGTLEGTVSDAVTGLPIEGALVEAVDDEGFAWSERTDQNGFYQMTVMAGSFDISASHEQHVAQTVGGVVVVEDGTTVQDFALEQRGWLYGTVTDLDNGFPLEGALVEAEDGRLAFTGPDGGYELWLDPGPHNVTASAEDYAPETVAVMIYPGAGTQQDLSLVAAIAFVPSPIEVSVPLGGSHSIPTTLYNRMPAGYSFLIREIGGGFLPLGTGASQEWGQWESLVLEAPAGPAEAAPGTAVAAGPYEPRPAGSVTIQRRQAVQEGPDVLLVAADWDEDGDSPIQGFLQAYGDLGQVYVYEAFWNTPTLAYLLNWDVVVTWSNTSYRDRIAMGDVLADYVDAGGKVIVTNFALGSHEIFSLGGRFMDESYAAMNGGAYEYTFSCLGDKDPFHPIMAGISDVCDTFRLDDTYLTEDSYEVARWQDGELFVAAKDDHTVASIAGYVGQAYAWSGQMADVLHNAILWLAAPADVPWLAEDPGEGVVPAEGNLPVDIEFDASPAGGVTQPGLYWAELKVDGEEIDVKVPVQMTVEAPPDWGKLEGTVASLGYCDDEYLPLEFAEVVIQAASGATWTAPTDANGSYTWWLPASESPLTVSVSVPEHEPGLAEDVVIAGGQTTLVDFPLRWLVPCLSVAPQALESTLAPGETGVMQFTLTNEGAAEASFEFVEIAQTDPPASAFAVDVDPGQNLVSFDSEIPGTWTVVAPLPDSTYYNAGDFINGDYGTLYVLDFLTKALYRIDTATGARTLVGPAEADQGLPWTGMTGSLDGTMYAASTNSNTSSWLYTIDLDTAEVTKVGSISNAPAIGDIAITPDGVLYGLDFKNDVLLQIDPASGAGTVIGPLGYDASWHQGMDYEDESGTLYIAAYNGDSDQGELRIADPATGNSVLVGAFPGGARVDSLAWATGGRADLPWFWEDPLAGTVPPDGGQVVVDVHFDAGQVPGLGDYLANLMVKSNDPVNGTQNVDVTMHVVESADTMHVGDIRMGYRERGGRYLVVGLVPIRDGSNGPVEGATVDVLWTAPNGFQRPQAQVTDAGGRARFRMQAPLSGVYEICVTSVSKVAWTYDPNQNLETCETLTVP